MGKINGERKSEDLSILVTSLKGKILASTVFGSRASMENVLSELEEGEECVGIVELTGEGYKKAEAIEALRSINGLCDDPHLTSLLEEAVAQGVRMALDKNGKTD